MRPTTGHPAPKSGTVRKLQALRALEVLEHIGSAEAWQVPEALVQGAPAARVTQEALFSLERLSKRAASFP